mmetsp:Transcript_32873/g.66738  ORF Transcript_32873/g.66738 Transcript_32873/m.66738 type:complete len:216 (-) Transcript_32873:463-1110(-)
MCPPLNRGAGPASVRVVGDEEAALVPAGPSSVLAHLSLPVGLGPRHQRRLRRGHVLVVPLPGLEDGLLQGSPVGESEGPGFFGTRHGVHRVQVQRRFLLRLSSREEGDAGDGDGERALQCPHSVRRDVVGRATVLALRSWCDHVGFEEGAFEQQVLVSDGPVDCALDDFGDFCRSLDRVLAIHQDFRFNDGHQTIVLTDGTVSCERPCVLQDCCR